MLTRLSILASLIFLTACGPEQTRLIVTPIPDDLLEPEPISDRRATTVRQLTILATEHLRSAQNANDKIVAIAEIQRRAETCVREGGDACEFSAGN